ncbi:E3 ubiquitin-protein ligase lubel-like [Liolophura sinensis]|uniref:E3 ubiquitin-protein ligase lubel-like n=1 Tax=Liolophura sinensis TaxID=3198878 RepID=UPI0031589857
MTGLLLKGCNTTHNLSYDPEPIPATRTPHNQIMEAELRKSRVQLQEDIWQNRDTRSSAVQLMDTGCSAERRYDILKFIQLLKENSQSLVQLQKLPVAFTVLEKYARHLLRPPKDRSAQWKLIKYQNPIFANKVDVIKGGRYVMHQMGYTLDLGDGLSFPDGVEPNPNQLVSLVADIILAREELETYCRGEHPHPTQLDPFISTARHELNGTYVTSNLPDVLPTPLPKMEKVLKTAPPIPSRTLKPPYSPTAGWQNLVISTCDICGENSPEMICTICDSKQLCVSCDEKWHRHPKRQSHKRNRLNEPEVSQSSPAVDVRSNKHSTAPPIGNSLSIQPSQPREPSPTHSDDSYYSIEESSPETKDSTGRQCNESGAVVPNLPIFSSDQVMHSSADLQRNSSLGEVGEAKGGHQRSSPGMPAPLPDVFFTENYDSPKAEAQRKLAALEDEIVSMEKSLESLIASSANFYNDPKYLQITQSKDMKLRKKMELLTKIQILSGSAQAAVEKHRSPRLGVEPSIEQQDVFYPPSVCRQTGPGGPPVRSHLPLTSSPSLPVFHYPPAKSHPLVASPSLSHIGMPSAVQQPNSSGSLPHRRQVQVVGHKSYSTLPRAPSSQPKQTPEIHIGAGSSWSPKVNRTPKINLTSWTRLDPDQMGGMVAQEQGSTPHSTKQQVPHQWECSHCTYLNKPGANICLICHRTSDGPRLVPEEVELGEKPREPHSLGLLTRNVHEEIEQVVLEKKEAQKRFLIMMQNPDDRLEKVQNSQNFEAETKLDPQIEEKRTPKSEFHSELSHQEQIGGLEFANADSLETSPNDSGLSASSAGLSWEGSRDVAQALEAVNHHRAAKQQLDDGKKVIALLRDADKLGFVPEELQIALEMCGNKKPVDWLKENWQDMIDTVIALATSEGQASTHNDIGQITDVEAKESLKKAWGNVEEAVKDCVSKRKKNFQHLVMEGPFPREAILRCLHQRKGDVEKALTDLQQAQLQPYLERIWQNPNNSQPEALLMAAANHEQDLVANSVISHEDFQEKVRDGAVDYERRVRMVLVEGRLQGWIRAKAVIHIFTRPDQNFALQDVIEAVKNCGDVASSLVYLQQECEICFSNYPMSKIRNFTHCPCKICTECLTQHLELVIKEQFIRNWACPVCQRPDIQQDDQAAQEHFTFLDMLLPMLVSREVREMFQTKLRDWRLMQDPNFRWCAHCGNGFIFNADQLKMECTSCNQHTCFKCKKPWEVQHEGLSCEEFAQWKFDNSPENQATGLARHLDQNGIVCPSCKMRYALAKGGCMHFKCPQCGHEFCSGCMLPFRRAESCKQFLWCHSQGLHCHHPRNCFFYLRDNEVEELQKLLKKQNVEFDIAPPPGQENTRFCPVQEQKELSDRWKDEACGREVKEGHAGLCQLHYKEYLVDLINKNNIDPVDIMDVDKIKNLLIKMEKATPAMAKNEGRAVYHRRLTRVRPQYHKHLTRVRAQYHKHLTRVRPQYLKHLSQVRPQYRKHLTQVKAQSHKHLTQIMGETTAPHQGLILQVDFILPGRSWRKLLHLIRSWRSLCTLQAKLNSASDRAVYNYASAKLNSASDRAVYNYATAKLNSASDRAVYNYASAKLNSASDRAVYNYASAKLNSASDIAVYNYATSKLNSTSDRAVYNYMYATAKLNSASDRAVYNYATAKLNSASDRAIYNYATAKLNSTSHIAVYNYATAKLNSTSHIAVYNYATSKLNSASDRAVNKL